MPALDPSSKAILRGLGGYPGIAQQRGDVCAESKAVRADQHGRLAAKLGRPIERCVMGAPNGTGHKLRTVNSSSGRTVTSAGRLGVPIRRTGLSGDIERIYDIHDPTQRRCIALILHPPRRTLRPAFQHVHGPANTLIGVALIAGVRNLQRLRVGGGNESKRVRVNIDVAEGLLNRRHVTGNALAKNRARDGLRWPLRCENVRNIDPR
jgi:hypothetical protein